MPRRTIIAVALAPVLVVAATAFASSQQYNGPAGAGPNAGVEFGAVLGHGHPTSVRRFEFHNIPVQCGGGRSSALSDGLSITMKVSATRRFAGSAAGSGGSDHVKVAGRFASGYSKATGTLRVTGKAAGCPVVDSGVVKWTAPKVGKPR